ncbi:centrosomal of 41 kDa isoform X1 [Labeo rohita]|uniref:Centrosomal of 41 kDa isoform X1 n=1 Tax=Labeo rohita TaxID=84645 RepID=A0A498MDP8_LABRO|nr:centrosomal of 41 kDa isoform X1 [Labeo rohita]
MEFDILGVNLNDVSLNEDEVRNGNTQDPDDVSVFSASPGLDRLSDQTNGSPQPTLLPPQSINNDESGDTAFSPRSTLQSVISGVGELDLDKNGQKPIQHSPVSTSSITECPYPDCPYLLLDVRDREQYDQCHIISVLKSLTTMQKNASGKIIILYDEDERIASQAATTMCERGFENLFMLSGGLKVVAQKFPEGMTTGSIPISCLPSPSGPGGRRLSSRMSTSSARSKASTVQSSRQGSSIAGSESARSRSSRPWK